MNTRHSLLKLLKSEDGMQLCDLLTCVQKNTIMRCVKQTTEEKLIHQEKSGL